MSKSEQGDAGKGTRPGGGKRMLPLLLAINGLLVALVFLLFSFFHADYQTKLRAENLGNIENLNRSAATIAQAMFSSWQTRLEDVARMVRARDMTYAETLAYLWDSNADPNRHFQLIGPGYLGHLAERDDSGGFIPLTYAGVYYRDLQTVLDRVERPQGLAFTPEFTDNHTAAKYFALYMPLSLKDDTGVRQHYTLLLAAKSREVLQAFNGQGSYPGLSTVLMDARGVYIVSNNDFKSDNFFQYLYVYNDLSLDERNRVQEEVLSSQGGDLYYLNSMEQACVFRYARVGAGDWYCVTTVPVASFRSAEMDIRYTVYIALVLMAMLAMDVAWLLSMNRRLRQSMAKEKEASEAKTDFLSRMSHDIRTPLNGIIGMTVLALDEANPAPTQEYLRHIDASGKFLLGLVNDVLDMSRVESGNMELHPEPYAYDDFRAYVRAVILPLCQAKNLTLRMAQTPDTPTALCVDRLRMNQIFFNLLSNAVKFTPQGGTVELLVEKTPLAGNRMAADFLVRDNGIGMSQEFQRHMFETFTQEHGDAAAAGTGLGLAIVQNLVKLMGGTIAVESQVGVGTTFRVHLEAEASVPAPAQPAPLAGVQRSLAGKRVLLCEDNRLNVIIAEKLLEKWGVSVDTAADGQAGIDLFTAHAPGYYDAILMDIMMPVLGGLEATRRIRALDRPDAARVPIIAMTANAYDTDVENSLAAGMNAHLAKPIEPRLMLETLTAHCK